MTSGLEKVILENPSVVEIARESKRQGMVTMRQDAIMKALEGLITMEEVFRNTEEQKNYENES
jgi:type II secretory ATPase GspE/PulE/Tfp pilus assembly ATPase PilB-like protein